MRAEQLEYVAAIARLGSFRSAAEQLHISQPALSKQIRDLEDEIGFSLFERTAKSVRLTDAGRSFLDDARAASLLDVDRAILAPVAKIRGDTQWQAFNSLLEMRIAFAQVSGHGRLLIFTLILVVTLPFAAHIVQLIYMLI